MIRTYDDGERVETPKFFIGREVENTPALGMLTLFCKGDVTLEEIEDAISNNTVAHVYLNSNHTDLYDSELKINKLLELGYWVTVEYSYFSAVLISKEQNDRFIPLVSIATPHIQMYNKNLSIKFDDVGFNVTMPGVWTVQFAKLPVECFTPWEAYKNDKVIK